MLNALVHKVQFSIRQALNLTELITHILYAVKHHQNMQNQTKIPVIISNHHLLRVYKMQIYPNLVKLKVEKCNLKYNW